MSTKQTGITIGWQGMAGRLDVRESAMVGTIIILALVIADWSTLQPILVASDKSLMLFLNYTGSPAEDQFWYGYSHMNAWIPLIGVVLFDCLFLNHNRWRDRLLFVAAVAVLLCITDQLSSGLIKPLIGRLRPSHDPSISGMLHYVGGYRGGMHGFVSSHAANIVALCTWLWFTFRDKVTRVVFVTFAVLMCYSRIYLGVHYPGDIIGGAVLGYVVARVMYHLVQNRIPLFTTSRPLHCVVLVFLMTLVKLAVMG